MSDVQFHSTYPLPLGYQDHHVTLMARDPYLLYAYWEIPSTRKDSFVRQFGQQLWDQSIPVLKVSNVSRNSSFSIPIYGHADCWFIEVPDASSLYVAELGRQVGEGFYISLASSNYIYTPGNHISSNTTTSFMDYRQVKSEAPDLTPCQFYTHPAGQGFEPGLSSPELAKITGNQSFGISSQILFR